MNPELEKLIEQARAALARGASPEAVDARFNKLSEGRYPTFASVLQAAKLHEAPAAEAKQLASESRALNKNPVSQFARMMGQGASLGFGDEIAGIIASAAPGGKGYTEARDDSRSRVEALRKEAPGASVAAELAGGLATGVAGVGRNAPAMVQGIIGGAITGAGEADGGIGERLRGAAVGGAAGGLLGGVFHGASLVRNPGGRLVAALPEGDIVKLIKSAKPGETIMDIGGPRVRKLARAAESIPSEGSDKIREALRDRSSRAPTRIISALQKDSGLTFENAVETAENLMAKQREAAAPLYEAAYARSVPVSVIADEMKIPKFRQAYERGRAIAETEGVSLPKFIDGELREIPVQAIDYMKRGLDDMIDGGMRGGRMGKAEARALRNRLRGSGDDPGLLGKVDKAVPEFAAARAQFAGDAAVQAAFESGRKEFFKLDPRQVAANLKRMSQSEREFYRRGALDAVRSRLESAGDGRDLTKVVFGNSESRKRIRQLFADNDSYKRFEETMTRERNMKETEQFVLGGSPTARIQAEQADLAGPKFKASDVVHPINTTGKVLDNVITNRLIAGGEGRVNKLAPMLTTPLGLDSDLLSQLQEFARKEAERKAMLGVGARAAGIGGGLLLVPNRQ